MNRARLSWLASWQPLSEPRLKDVDPSSAEQNEILVAESKKRPDVPETPFPSEEPESPPTPPPPMLTLRTKKSKSTDGLPTRDTLPFQLDPLATAIPQTEAPPKPLVKTATTTPTTRSRRKK